MKIGRHSYSNGWRRLDIRKRVFTYRLTDKPSVAPGDQVSMVVFDKAIRPQEFEDSTR